MKDKNEITVCGKGYIGYGPYSPSKDFDAYKKWREMLRRCYAGEYLNHFPSYTMCMVCDEWLSFQNFAKWYYEHIYPSPDTKSLALDKDIRVKGNKIYGPNTCLLVPQRINCLLVNRKRARGKFVLGVVNYRHGKYEVCCTVDGHTYNLGVFNTQEEGFMAFKFFKENVIRERADSYIGLVPKDILDCVRAYEIEITD